MRLEENEAGRVLACGIDTLYLAVYVLWEKTEFLEQREDVLAGATIEEKRELVQKYVRAVKACPDTQKVAIRLYAALFNDLVAGAGFAARRRWRRTCDLWVMRPIHSVRASTFLKEKTSGVRNGPAGRMVSGKGQGTRPKP